MYFSNDLHMIRSEVYGWSETVGSFAVDETSNGPTSDATASFDGSADGGWTWADIEAFGAREYGEWAADAFQDLDAILSGNAAISNMIDALVFVENPSDQLINAGLNSIVDMAMNDPSMAGDLVDWVSDVNYYFDQADAWYDANGFEDPYLDWGYRDWDYNYFWAASTPSWWGSEYGLW